MDIPHLLQRLQADNTSGATALVELALDILEAFAAQELASEPHDFHAALQHLVGAVLAAQPSMAVMINLAQQVLQACPEKAPHPVIKPLPEREGKQATGQNQRDAVLASG